MAMVDSAPLLDDTVWIPDGSFMMGSDRHYPEEAPAHRVTVDGFWIDRYPVTNARVPRASSRRPATSPLAETPADPGRSIPARGPSCWCRRRWCS